MGNAFGWFLAFVVTLIGLAQWFYFSKKLEFKHGVNRLLLHALTELYRRNFVGGCNNRYDSMGCHAATPLKELCAPCFGRRMLEDSDGILRKILEPEKDQP